MCRDDLLRRVKALQRKQRAGKGAPPTPSGRLSSVPLSEVPDFTPLPSRQSSVQPGFDRHQDAALAMAELQNGNNLADFST